MAVSTSNAFSGPYIGNGVTTTFPFTFQAFTADDVSVLLRTDGAESVAGGDSYSVTFAGALPSGGSIVFAAAPASGVEVLPFLDVAFEQQTSFADGSAWKAAAVNSTNDKSALRDQVLKREVDRSLKAPLDESGIVLPPASDRAGAALFFDDSGNATTITPDDFAAPAALSATEAETARASAELLALAIYLLGAGIIYDDTAGGLDPDTGVAPGEFFVTWQDARVRLYLNDAGVVVLKAEFSTVASVQALLGASSGAAQVGFLQSGTGAVARTVQGKLREIQVSPEDFGADPTGATSAVAAFIAAGVYLASRGGGNIVGSGKYLIDANFTLPDCVSLIGPWEQPDEILPGTAADYDALHGQLIIASTATIGTGDSCAVRGWVVRRQGLDLPFVDATAATAGVAAFAGTAFTVAGAGSTFRNLLILGFNKAIVSNNYERVRIAYVSGDCTNGIEVSICYDISYVNFCHFWPWTTVHQTWTTNALLRRSGHAYLFYNVADWNMVSHCFSYGYARGGRTASCDNMTWINCGADNTSTAGVGDHTGSIGFTAEGTSKSTRWIGLQAAAQQDGYHINVSAGNHVEMSSCQGWAASSRGVLIDSGDVNIEGGELRDTPLGVLVNSTTSRVFIDKVRFRNHSTAPIGFNVVNATTFIGNQNDFSDTAAGSSPISSPSKWPIVAIASAATLDLPAVGADFNITGTTGVTGVGGGWKGRQVTLYFAGVLTLTHGTGSTSSIRLSGGVNFTTTATATLTLRHNGTQWFEVGRCA